MAYYIVLGEVPVKRKLDFVEFDSSELVMKLRYAIYDKKRNTFTNQNIDENDLILWKVNIPFDNENDNLKMLDDTSCTINVKRDLEGKEMFPADLISKHLLHSDKTQLSICILVQPQKLATTGKRKTEDSNEDQAKREKLEPFQQDEEKIRNFIENLQNINTKDKMFTVPALPRRSGATTIFIRECYGYLSDFILNDIDTNRLNRYCIIGNPGIGKSYFGILMLVELIKRYKTVLIDYEGFTARISPNGDILRVENDDHTLYGQIAEKKDVWCIIDSVMPKFNHDLIGRFIMVSSPKKQFIDRFIKAQKSKIFYMPPWEINELYDCQMNLYKQFTRNQIEEKFNLCGGVARWIFDNEMTPDEIKLRIEGALSSIDLKSLLRAQGEHFSGDGFSHKLIHIKTNEDMEDNPYTKAICTFASNYAEDICLDKFKEITLKIYVILLRIQET